MSAATDMQLDSQERNALPPGQITLDAVLAAAWRSCAG